MSSEPPLSGCAGGGSSGLQRRGEADLAAARPGAAPPWQRSAPRRSIAASRPASILACTASAIGLLKWRGAATPTSFARHRGVGHHRGGFRDLVADLVVALDVLEVDLAEEVPDRGERRNDVGLVAAIGDHVVGALFGTKLLAAEIPADVHELDRAQRVAAAPGPGRGVRGFALEGVFDRDQAGAAGLVPTRYRACRPHG